MSFILDALKKSENERQRQAGPALLEMRIVRPPRRLPIWALVVGVLLIISVGVLAWLALRPAPAPATASALPPAPANAGVSGNGSAANGAGAAQAPARAAPDTPGPATAPASLGGAAAAAPATVPPPAQTATMAADNNPADTEPAVAPPAGSTQESNSAASLHTYSELGGSLPELRLDLHVYAANPAERYAFINMHKVREGDVTTDGVQVKEITREGVVLEYHGTEFLLGRQ
jgi:general secretion pathway protein B